MRAVIISGLPCSGKSKLAAQLQARFRWPLLAKDDLKEALFDSLGIGDREWSKKLSGAAYEILFRQAEMLIKAQVSCILEGNFREQEQRQRFRRLHDAGAQFVQVFCRADAEVLIRRFRERAGLGVRHAGHVDDVNLSTIEREMRGDPQKPLNIGGGIIECDTTYDWQQAINVAIEQTLAALRD